VDYYYVIPFLFGTILPKPRCSRDVVVVLERGPGGHGLSHI